MLRSIFLVIILFISFSTPLSCSAQSVLPVDTVWARPFYLKTTPFSFLNVYKGAAVSLSGEYYMKNRNSLQLDLTLFHQAFEVWGIYDDLEGFGISPSYTFNKMERVEAKRTSFSNLSISIDYAQLSYIRTDSFEISTPPIPASQKFAYLSERRFIGASGRAGMKTVFRRGFMIEFYFSLGFLINSIDSELSWAVADQRYFGDSTSPYYSLQAEGTHLIPRFGGGFKIGYGFKQKKK